MVPIQLDMLGKVVQLYIRENMPFIKGEEINVVIGQGGSAATTINNAGNKGGDTSFGTLIALGGNGGDCRNKFIAINRGVMEQLVHLEI